MNRRKWIITLTLVVILVIITYRFFYVPPPKNIFSVLKAPVNIDIKGDSAKFMGRAQYEVYVTVINKTGKPLAYVPVFGIVKDKYGNKIGLAMGNTGMDLKLSDTAKVTMDAVIPKELGRPVAIELYSE